MFDLRFLAGRPRCFVIVDISVRSMFQFIGVARLGVAHSST